MQNARKSGDEDKYFKLLDKAGTYHKDITYRKPIYFTSDSSVAKTYTDPHRSVDYQNAEPNLLKANIDETGKILKIPAYGESFRGIKADLVKKALMSDGIPEETIDNYFNMFQVWIKNGKMSAETLAIIAQQLEYDIVDILGVLDSYHVGSTRSTVRMIFDPNKIKLINENRSNLLENNNKYPEIPNILYHGQPPKYDNKGNRSEPVKFKKFDQSQKRFLKNNHYGFYFTPSKNEAFDYAEGGNVYECNVIIKNPYYYEYMFSYTNNGLIKSGNFIDREDYDKLQKNNYDGVVILTSMNEIGEVIALNPEQIKIIKIIS
jgi:hypothetical protein